MLQSLKDSCLLPDIYFERLGKLRESFCADECTSSSDACLTNGSVGTDEPDDNDVAVEVEDTDEDVERGGEQESALQSASNAKELTDSCKSLQLSAATSQDHLDAEEAADTAANAETNVTSDLSPLRPNESNVATCSSTQIDKTQRRKRKHASGQRYLRKRHKTENEIVSNGQKDAVDSSINAAESVSGGVTSSGSSEGNQQECTARKSVRKNVKKRKTNGLRNIRCQECPFKAQTVEKLRNHTRTAHRDRQTFCCSMCSFKTRWNREYYKHMATHFTGPPYRCERCTFTADRIRPLVIHLMDHTDSRPYSCRTCGIRFKMKNNLVAHERCHSGIHASVTFAAVCKRVTVTNISVVHWGQPP